MNSCLAKSDSWRMFDGISSRYDLLNHVLSGGLDIAWRRRLAGHLPDHPGQTVLDLATGTADVLLSLVKFNQDVHKGVGIDLAEQMLAVGRRKIEKSGYSERLTLQHGDINQIPFPDNHFDTVTIAFGIRNVDNPVTVLKEMYRVLDKKGRAIILEFSLPANPLWKCFYLLYLRTCIPLIGGLLSGSIHAYRYLNQTVEKFPSGERFCRMVRQVGFRHVKGHNFLGGIAAIYQGDKG